MTRATLNGLPCLDSGPVRWPLRPGVEPVTAQFDMTPDDAEGVLGAPEVMLNVTGPRESFSVHRLSVLSEVSSGNPAIRTVMVTDQRWWWRYRYIRRGYNIRRLIGVRRLKDPQTLEIQPVPDDVTFAPWSLYPPDDGQRKWLAGEVLRDVLAHVLPSGRSVPDTSGFDEIPIEDLKIDDSGDGAVRRVLDFLVGAAITVGLDGEARLYSRLSGREAELAGRIPDEIEDGGHLRMVSRRFLRPSKITVLFTREHELRFDFEETASKTSTAGLPAGERVMDNVLPVSDFELELSSGKTVAQGTWITFVQALNAWGDVPILGALDLPKIQEAMVPFIDLWSGVRLAGMLVPPDEYADWAGRIGAIQQHYRQTFRIRRQWMDRIRSLRAYRVALLDVETGTRGPAVAYTNFAYLSSNRSLWADFAAGVGLNYATNIRRYPVNGVIGRRDAPAPCRVSIVDGDEGVIRLDFLGDAFGVHTQAFPSMIELQGSTLGADGYPKDHPHADLKRARFGESVAFNAIARGSKRPKLTGSHKAAVILTAIAGSPNTNDQLFGVEIRPDEVAAILPPGNRAGISDRDCLGPPMEIRIAPSIETARIPWLDNQSEVIETAFGVRPGPKPDLSDLVLNLEGASGPEIGGASLRSVAIAAAARVYGSMADRLEGAATFDLAPNIGLDGWIQEVSHELTVNGETFTLVTLPQGETAPVSLFALMDNGTRATLLKLASPERG